MDSLKSICRICLEQKVDIDWNDEIERLCGISYKDCYYKYTHLEEPAADCYPTYLCDKCAGELKSAHIFFENALDSFKILQNTFKSEEVTTENFLLKNFYNSEEIIEEKELYDIDEVICYSPVNDDVDIVNELNEIIYHQNFEPSSETTTEQQHMNSYIKILNTSSESRKPDPKRENHGSFETTVELNLQLEIHGSNLLNPNFKKSNTRFIQASNHSTKEQSKRKINSEKSTLQQTVQCNVSIERVLNSHQEPSDSEMLHNDLESLKTDDEGIFDEQSNNTFDESVLEVDSVESRTNDDVPLNDQLSKPRELHKSSIAKSCGRKRGSELAEYLLFMQNFNGGEINNLVGSTANLKSNGLPKLSISDRNGKLSQQSANRLSEEHFGKDADKNGLRVCKPQKQKEIMCQYCSKVFISIYKAIEHEKTHLENRERKETCTKCGLKFYNKNALRSHMYTHKENREKNLKCEFCGKAFYNNNGLSIHRRIHVGPRIPCSICSKEYYRQSDLDKHMISHSATRVDGDLKYRKKYFVYCEICGNEVRSVEYKSHIAKHNNEPLAKCAICNKEFFSRKSCISHLKSVHRKGSGERSNFAISYKTKYYSKLFLQQKTGTLFTKDKV